MTDRISSLTVVLEPDTREDDAQATIDAIKQLRGVVEVGSNIADIRDYTAIAVARNRLRNAVWKAFSETE